MSESLTSAECRCSNIEREALSILHSLKKSHHYCFARDVNVITDHKPLVVIFKKGILTLSQGIQQILLRTYQYRVRTLYKPGPEIFIADWLSQHNHKENKDEAISGIDVQVDAVQTLMDVPECMLIQHRQWATAQDEHLQ